MNKYNLYEKEKRILFYFIGWFIVAICIFLIGILNVNAATYNMNYEYLQKYYDNNGSTVTAVTTTWNESLQSYVSNNITTIANSYGAGLSITSPIPLIANHTYTLSVYFDGISNIAKSSKNNIAISTSLTGAASNYANNNFYVDMIQTSVSNNSIIQFVFTTKGGGNYIFFPWTTTSNLTHSYVLTQISMEDLGSEGISQQDINNSLNTQTNELNNSIQNSTDTITGEIDDMEQNIIDSNKETQDVIKDQFNTCRDSYNLSYVSSIAPYNYSATLNDGVITMNGTSTSAGNLLINLNNANELTLNANTTYTFSIIVDGTITGSGYKTIYFKGNNVGSLASNKIIIFQYTPTQNTVAANIAFDLSPNLTFSNTKIKVMLNEGSSPKNYEQYGEKFCTNKIDETNDKLDDLNGSLNDSNIDGSLGDAGGFFNNFSTSDHGGLSGIITSPLVAINQMLNKSCNPMTTNFKGKEISLPCGYQFWSKMGAIQEFLNLVLGGLLCYQIIIKLFNLIEKIKNPEDDRVEVMKL